mmetsp:Transcript_61523/g.127117  ORF Transcript_61523/g.127117 Transcript_61523/m.127117 type:complete len:224 (-) Transcript_61523:3890-4561(-)
MPGSLDRPLSKLSIGLARVVDETREGSLQPRVNDKPVHKLDEIHGLAPGQALEAIPELPWLYHFAHILLHQLILLSISHQPQPPPFVPTPHALRGNKAPALHSSVGTHAHLALHLHARVGHAALRPWAAARLRPRVNVLQHLPHRSAHNARRDQLELLTYAPGAVSTTRPWRRSRCLAPPRLGLPRTLATRITLYRLRLHRPAPHSFPLHRAPCLRDHRLVLP